LRISELSDGSREVKDGKRRLYGVPARGQLSDVVQNHDGSGTWNATCNGEVYLCSSVSIRSESGPFNCAPAAK
jgi:hypothetical protein